MTLKTKLRKIYFAFSRQRLKNKSFTLISNNCLAGCDSIGDSVPL